MTFASGETMRRFAPSAAGAAVVLLALGAVFVVDSDGGRAVDVLRDAGQLAFAGAAAVTCALMARRLAGRERWAWAMLAASAGIAAAGELGELAGQLVTGGDLQFPTTADFGFVIAGPVAMAGLLAFRSTAYQYATRRRFALDLTMVALSLAFVSSALALPQKYFEGSSPAALLVGLAYPVVDVAIATVIFASIRRSLAIEDGRLLLVVAGLGLNALFESASVYLSGVGVLPALGYVLNSGSMYAYALVALAPLWPKQRTEERAGEVAAWPDLIPYLGIVLVAVVAVVLQLTGQHFSSYASIAGVGLAAVLVASAVLSHSESRELVLQSRRAEAEVRERETMLNSVIDHAPQGVARVDLERRILTANPRLASMLYTSLPEVTASSLDAYLPDDYVARVFESLTPDGEVSTETYESDCQARRADGSTFWVHWTATPIHNNDGSLDCFLSTFEDVTAKREAEETAVANLAQLEKLNRLKSEFVATVSHEFRTALVGIQGFSELIRDQDMEGTETKVLAEEIYNDSLRLNRMITEMLDFDRLEAGKLQLDLKPLDINLLVRGAVEHAAVTTKTHALDLKLAAPLPNVRGDSDRLTQVLTNLLSNAIKYSPDGGDICVGTRLSGGFVEVSVRDHGRGIPAEFISRLFGKYERYEDKHAGRIIGTGLGLAITRQIIEMHGGRITVQSVEGEGSDFRFTVPLVTSAGQREAPAYGRPVSHPQGKITRSA